MSEREPQDQGKDRGTGAGPELVLGGELRGGEGQERTGGEQRGLRGPPPPPGALLGSRILYEGRVVQLALDRVRFPDGSEGQLELVRHRGAAAVVPLLEGDSPDPRVVLVHQYRYGAGGYLFEIPAGIPRPAEPWEDCARRELEEETGYRAGRLIFLTRFFTTPGFSNEVLHLFAAEDLSVGRTGRDRDEFLEVVEFPLSRCLEMVLRGEIRDGKSVAGLLFVDRFLRTRREAALP